MQFRAPRRGSNRHLTAITAAGAYDVQAVNYSRTGVALKGMPPVPKGTILTLKLAWRTVPGLVAWHRRGLVGVQFYHALTISEAQIFGPYGGLRGPAHWQVLMPLGGAAQHENVRERA